MLIQLVLVCYGLHTYMIRTNYASKYMKYIKTAIVMLYHVIYIQLGLRHGGLTPAPAPGMPVIPSRCMIRIIRKTIAAENATVLPRVTLKKKRV